MKYILPIFTEIKYGTRTKSNQKKMGEKIKSAAAECTYCIVGSIILAVSFALCAFAC